MTEHPRADRPASSPDSPGGTADQRRGDLPGTAAEAPGPQPVDRSPQSRLVDRYGATRQNKFTGRVVVIVLVLLMLTAGVYIVRQVMHSSAAPVQAVQSGGRIISDDRLQMRVDVTRDDPNAASYCIVKALDYDKNEVGRRGFVVPAGGPKTARMMVDVQTTSRGYAGAVYGCSDKVPNFLTPRT
ncbi:DUF4307 domain-containing protein [Corynebacterium heidelbergense]|uniref:DUF4307 domain-containing protein n=1 Tax=Corynebacterium heidelbergense TaxID=2055947 RepID=A0A364V5L1_9CORY|nr:DUF4307 domain-containing protein [Corynebacterium heidelbergense]RAV31930.1 DUF4307 domain-containing protein [Corynebacterium heidelbergense]